MFPGPRACCLSFVITLSLTLWAPVPCSAQTNKKAEERFKEIAGTAEFLRSVPKRFAILQAADPAHDRVTLLVEGESVPKVWPLAADAEIKVAGWWGRLDQFAAGDRVWAWFKTDRQKKPVAISMLADELSEQDIHDAKTKVVVRDADSLTIKRTNRAATKLKLDIAKAEFYQGAMKSTPSLLRAGEQVFVQTTAGGVRLMLDPAAFEVRRSAQKAQLRKRWIDEGLPGTVTFLHIFSGEMEFILDHEAMRWGRALKVGDKVTLQTSPPIPGVVKQVHPWRERTELRLVVNGVDQADLVLGQRIKLRLPVPSIEVENSPLPPDLGQRRDKTERVEWFLASIYCTCGIAGDTCTGHFYTLSSCNPNGCGMPNSMRQVIAEHIDKGLNDQQIFEVLLKEHGLGLLRQHLMP
jgi:hypothetical protein